MIANTDNVSSWESKGLSAETFKPPATSDNGLTPAFTLTFIITQFIIKSKEE